MPKTDRSKIAAAVHEAIQDTYDIDLVDYTNRLCSTAAPMKLANSGCGSKGRLFSSG